MHHLPLTHNIHQNAQFYTKGPSGIEFYFFERLQATPPSPLNGLNQENIGKK